MSTFARSVGYEQGWNDWRRTYSQASMKNVHSASAITGPTRGAFDTAMILIRANVQLSWSQESRSTSKRRCLWNDQKQRQKKPMPTSTRCTIRRLCYRQANHSQYRTYLAT